MGLTYDQRITSMINYLEQQGYKVTKDESSLVEKPYYKRVYRSKRSKYLKKTI